MDSGLPLARSRSVAQELAATDAAIERATVVVPTLARPPHGGRSPRNVSAFHRVGKRLVLWDVNSYDWRGGSAEDIARSVVERARPAASSCFTRRAMAANGRSRPCV
jgi:peptidoglycan-N-acetylglucosamine deacetylase